MMITFGTEFWKFYCKGVVFPQQSQNFSKFVNVLKLQAAVTLQWLQIAGNSLPKYPSAVFPVSIYTVGINSKSFPWPVHSIQETFPNFLQRMTWVDNMADNADITQSQAANYHRLLSHVTLGLLECRKYTACAQTAEFFEPNTVLWAFHTIQPSSCDCQRLMIVGVCLPCCDKLLCCKHWMHAGHYWPA